jgi:hypothetical protein
MRLLHCSPARIALAGLLASAMPAAPAESVYLEENGVVCIEAETAESPLGDWKSHADASFKDWVKGFLGKGCLQFTGNQESSGSPKCELTFPVLVRNAGIYKLAIRGLEAPLETGEGDKANDCYVRMEGQPDWKGKFTKCVLLGDSYRWSWNVKSEFKHHTFEQATYELTAGLHMLQIAGRSKNFFLDRIVLYKGLSDKEAQSDALPPSKRIPRPR